MKTTMIALTLAVLTSSAMAAVCPKPNEYAKTAFKIIETSTMPAELDNYLKSYTVARTAVNESCEDMYMMSLRKRNEGARQVLERIGYGPRNKEALNSYENQMRMSYFDYAISFASLPVIRELYSRGGSSYYALSLAARTNTIDVIDWLLLEQKASADAVLGEAVGSNKKSVIEQIIRRGANVSMPGIVELALRRMIQKPEDKDVLELLIRAGAPVSFDSMKFAVSYNTKDTFEFLRMAGGPVSTQTLAHAIEVNRLDMVKHLISVGVSLTDPLSQGKNLLMFAAANGTADMMNLILDQGLNIEEEDNKGNSAIAYASTVEVIKILKARGLEIDKKNREGLNALHRAVIAGEYSKTENLIKGGANPNLPTGLGYYPIHLAFQDLQPCKDPKAIISALVDNGAKIDQKNAEGYTILMRAAQISGCGSDSENSSEAIANRLIKYLLLNKADKRIKVKYGREHYNAYEFYTNRYRSDSEVAKLLKP